MEQIHGRKGVYSNHAVEATEYRKRYDTWNKKNGEGNSKHDKVCLGITKPKAVKAAAIPEFIILPDVGGLQPAPLDDISDPDFDTFSEEERDVMTYGATLTTLGFLELQIIARAAKASSQYEMQGADPAVEMDETNRLVAFRGRLRDYLRKTIVDSIADKASGVVDKSWAFEFTTYVIQVELSIPDRVGRERKLMYEQLRGLMRGVLKTKGGSDLKGFDAAPDLNSQSPFTTFQTPVKIPVAGFSSIKASKVSPILKIGSYRYYALYRGRDVSGKEVGGKVFLSWEAIKPYVEGVPGNIHKGFDLHYQAENFSMTGDANISQEALLEFLARPEPKPAKAPAKKDQRESLFNPKYHQLRTVIEGDEVVSLTERRLMGQLEAQQVINRELQKKTERLLEELGSVRSGGSLKRAEARKASGGSGISSVSHCLEFE
jgi:hypothetical protein